MKNLLTSFFIGLSLFTYGQFDQIEYINTAFSSISELSYGDMDGDGKMDMLFADQNYGRVGWVKNIDADGTWSTMQLIDLTYEDPTQIRPGDINGDGLLDVVVLYSQEEGPDMLDNLVVWYENLGGGEFSEGIEIGGDNNPSITVQGGSMDLGDVDNDGDLDIVAAYHIANKVVWFRNEDGFGSFSAQIELATDYVKPQDSGHPYFLYQRTGDYPKFVFAGSRVMWKYFHRFHFKYQYSGY